MITCTLSKAGPTTFTATANGLSVTSKDPEHAMCRALKDAGYPDSPIEFVWTSGSKGLISPSFYEMSKWSVDYTDTGFRRSKWLPNPKWNESKEDALFK